MDDPAALPPSKKKSLDASILDVLNPSQTNKIVKNLGAAGFVLLAVSTVYGLYAAFSKPGGILVDLAAGYLLGFLFAALVHDLACALKSEGSELQRYVNLAKGTKLAWLAWTLVIAAAASVIVLIYLQLTVEVTRTTLMTAIISSVLASEFTMMYVNKIQDFRQSLLRPDADQP